MTTSLSQSQLSAVCAKCPMFKICTASGKQVAISCDGIGIYQCRKGRSIYQKNNPGTQVHILREGWAFRFIVLPNGRRQIVEFLLPGDPILLPLIFVDRLPYNVHALTDAMLCTFMVSELTDHIKDDTHSGHDIEVACASALLRNEWRLAQINQRNSQERTAWLLFSLFNELKNRGLADGNVTPFPLSLCHIADALGITVTHASRTLSALKREGLISLGRDRLTVHHEQELANVALMPATPNEP